MKFFQVVSRLALLALATAAFVGLTAIYGRSAPSPLPDAIWREGRDHRPSAPEVAAFPEFVGEFMVLAIVGVGGRVVLRLRLSPASRSEGQLILLGLHRESKTFKPSVFHNWPPVQLDPRRNVTLSSRM
jgi:hypothetical protein